MTSYIRTQLDADQVHEGDIISIGDGLWLEAGVVDHDLVEGETNVLHVSRTPTGPNDDPPMYALDGFSEVTALIDDTTTLR